MIIIVEFQLYARKVIVLTDSRGWCVFHVDDMWTSKGTWSYVMPWCWSQQRSFEIYRWLDRKEMTADRISVIGR